MTCGTSVPGTPERWIRMPGPRAGQYRLLLHSTENGPYRVAVKLEAEGRDLFNLDWSDTIYLHDLTKTFPWPDASIDVVYSSHTLEHLSKEDGHRFLAECHRVI